MGFAVITKWVNGENLLTVDIDGTRYEYETSPFAKERFQYMLRFNQGKALSFLKNNSTLIRSYSLTKPPKDAQ
jgi:lipoprotein signal peptidase